MRLNIKSESICSLRLVVLRLFSRWYTHPLVDTAFKVYANRIRSLLGDCLNKATRHDESDVAVGLGFG